MNERGLFDWLSTPSLRHGLAVAFGLSFLVYWNSLFGQFVFDDDSLILENPLVTDARRFREIFLGADGQPSYRPIRTFTYAIDHLIWETNPAGYHLSNIYYHSLVALLIFVIVQRLGLSGALALAAAAVFAVHPVHTDAVSYISGRRDVLSTLFYLCGFACYLEDRRSPRPLAIVGMALFYVAGIFTKEMAVTLPFVCLAYHWTWGRTRPDETGRGPWFYGAFIAAGVLYAYYAVMIQHGVTMRPEPYGSSRWITLLTMSRVFWHYVWLLVWPVRLLADYSYDAFPLSRGIFEPGTLVALIGVLVAGLLPFALVRSRPRIAFGLFWHWLTLGPVAQIIAHSEMMAEHYLYLPSAAFAVGIVSLVAHAFPGRRWAVPLVALLGLYSVRTILRNRVWMDSRSLWETTVTDAPRCARAHTNLGLVYESEGTPDAAEAEYKTALSILPGDPYTLNNLGTLYMQRGSAARARPLLEAALQIYPQYAEGLNNLGAIECDLGMLERSERHLREALTVRPNYRSALLNLGLTLRRMGPKRYPEVEETYLRALAAAPNDATVANNLGALYLDWGKAADAVRTLEAAVRLAPGLARPRVSLARALMMAGQPQQAASQLVQAATLEMDDPTLQDEAAGLASKLGNEHLAKELQRLAQERRQAARASPAAPASPAPQASPGR